MKVKFKGLFVLALAFVMGSAALLPVRSFATANAAEPVAAVEPAPESQADSPVRAEKNKYNPATLTEKLAKIDSADVTQVTQAIEEDLIEQGTSVEESLTDQLNYYTAMADRTEDEDEIARINHMIIGTQELLEEYSEQKIRLTGIDDAVEDIDTGLTKSALSVYVTSAIAYLNAQDYKLTAELLTYADRLQEDAQENYIPIHGYRILSSALTYSFFDSNLMEKSITYPLPDEGAVSRNEVDLGYAIHGATIARENLNNKVIILSDKYDFHEGYYPGAEGINEKLMKAQELGVIHTFSHKITLDLSETLRPKVRAKENGIYSVDVYNYSNKSIELIYNAKMCFQSNAKEWENLSDIKFINLPANSYATITISENVLATDIVLSYIKGNYRYVTYADNISTENHLNIEQAKLKHISYDFDAVIRFDIAGHNGTTWFIDFDAHNENLIYIEYCPKLCTEEEANDWFSLTDIVYQDMSKRIKRIAISGVEDYFVFRITHRNETVELICTDLDLSGSMNVQTKEGLLTQTYLIIKNMGKEGSNWRINIFNPTTRTITVKYNAKMCFFDDAKNWKGLSDVQTKEIEPGKSETVSIATNWFATSIAISYQYGKRIITYGDGLKTNGAMNIYHNGI